MIVWLLLVGCGRSVTCEGPDTVLAEAANTALTCGQATWLVDYWELLRATPIAASDRRLVRRALANRFDRDPSGTRALLEQIRTKGTRLGAQSGPEAARERSRTTYEALNGRGLIPRSDGELARLQAKLLPVWGSSEGAQVSLSEADMESWIRYASLCREVQGGTPLRISVADRVGVYRVIQDRFNAGSEAEQVALASLGAIWAQAQPAWQRANFVQQQAWIRAAPLPAPMTGTSRDYLKAIVDGDVVGHVQSLFDHLGPFTLRGDRPMFLPEDP